MRYKKTDGKTKIMVCYKLHMEGDIKQNLLPNLLTKKDSQKLEELRKKSEQGNRSKAVFNKRKLTLSSCYYQLDDNEANNEYIVLEFCLMCL